MNSQAARDALIVSLSEARLSKYLGAARNDVPAALGLYEYNMLVSAAFYAPLQCLEVCLRNKMHAQLRILHGDAWFQTSQSGLAPHLADDVVKALKKITQAKKSVTPGAVLAELSFGFWVAMLGREYDQTLWRRGLARTFRPNGRGLSRQIVHGRLNMLRRFRNRVAHYEPIFHLELARIHAELLETVGWMCPHTALWVGSISRVPELLGGHLA